MPHPLDIKRNAIPSMQPICFTNNVQIQFSNKFITENNLNSNGYPLYLEFLLGLKENNSQEPEQYTVALFDLKDPISKIDQNKDIIIQNICIK